MRFSLISLTFLSAFFACVAASPVVVHRTPQSGSILSERGLQRTQKGAFQLQRQAPKKVAVKHAGAVCAIRPSTKHPRDLEFAYLDRRGDLTDKLLPYQIESQKVTGGSYGDIFNIIGRPDLLAKKISVKAGGKPVSLEEFRDEARHVQAVGQFQDWGYTLDWLCQTRTYYIIMKKVSGIPLHLTEAYRSTLRDPGARTTLLNHVAELVAHKMMDYHRMSGILHVDPNGSNIMCNMNRLGQIISVDLVDWGNVGRAENVPYHVALDIAKTALEPMYPFHRMH